MLKNAPDYSALAPPGRKKVDWSSQDKHAELFVLDPGWDPMY